jgi:predicted ThiF/HesA family dinucleotide-utilizing enzyme
MPGKVKTQDQQLQELREAVVAIAVALDDALPATREFIQKIDALVDTWNATAGS